MGRKQTQALIAALIAWPVWAQEYTPALIPPQIIGSPTTMTAINGGDDSTQLISLGFPFQYYGQTFTQAWVSTNGFVSFHGPSNLCCDGLPIDQAQRNTIYGYWTDLVSRTNPYYQTDANISLFGWYDTTEYGTRNKITFEIGLFPDGKIQFNYGDLANSGHIVSAGITGPNSTDNIQLFYGPNVQFLQNQSGILSPTPQEPEPQPTFNPTNIIPDGAFDPVVEVAVDAVSENVTEETQTIVEEVIQDAVEEATAETEEIVNTIEDELVEEQVVQAKEDISEESDDEERLSPDELQALAGIDVNTDAGDNVSEGDVSSALQNVEQSAQEAEEAKQYGSQSGQGGPTVSASGSSAKEDLNAQSFQREAINDADSFSRETVLGVTLQSVAFVAEADIQYNKLNGEQTTTEAQEGAYTLSVADGSTFAPSPVTGMLADSSSVSSQTQQMELLNKAGMQGEMSSGVSTDIGDISGQDAATMTQLASAPEGYGTYTQAKIPDVPFYQPKDIYKGRRIPDANMVLYRIMKGNDATWTEMVESQYE